MRTGKLFGPQPSYVKVTQANYGRMKRPLIVAGPCSIEDDDTTDTIARVLRRSGVDWMRGGVYRAGTYGAYGDGFQEKLLKSWRRIAHGYGLKIAVEVIDLRVLSKIDRYADAFQVGARQMQNYGLLRALRGMGKPVFLKRNMGATLDEFLGAAEYLLNVPYGTIPPVILVERGGSTHMNHVRWDLSVSLIPAAKAMTGLPVIVDASHGTGRRDLVEPMTLAGMAAGADGFMVEVHPDPDKSMSDAEQALPLENLMALAGKAIAIRKIAMA